MDGKHKWNFMLSIKPISSASGAGQYYSAQDNYYLSDNEKIDEQSTWYGKGAQRLGLSGVVDSQTFLHLLEGKLPNGQQLGIVDEHGERHHRPGTDLTFSAPKSVSLLALVGGDKRLIQAHNESVREALDTIESMAAEARVTLAGNTTFEKTNNLTIALFQHTTSRELDAALHDHCVTMNVTERTDGKWRALSSRAKNDKANPENGFREIIYQNQHYFGLVYTSSLAKKTCDLGYEIEVKDRHGNFEIKGLSEQYLEASSKRRTQILDKLKTMGLSSAKAAEKANLASREDKSQVHSDALKKIWMDEAQKYDVNHEQIISDALTREKGSISVVTNTEISESVKEAIDNAIEDLSQFNTRIRHGDLVRSAFMYATGTIHHDEIEQDINQRLNKKELQGVASEYYTTETLIRAENRFIKQFKASIGSSFTVDCKKSGIAADVLRCRDRVQLIDVKGLNNEKELIETLVHSSEANGLGAYVLHIGRLQTNRLGDAINRDSSTFLKWFKNIFKSELTQTVAGFKSNYEQLIKNQQEKQDIIIVHDAQKLSYQDLMELEKLTEKSDSKLILLNNTRSTEGFRAGSPLKALKEAGFKSTISQTNEKLATIDIIESKRTHQDLAKAFANLSESERKTTKIIAFTNKDCDLLTASVRAELKEQGILSIQTKETTVLSTQTLSDVQKRQSKFYEEGYQITLNPFSKNQELYRVKGKNNQSIIVENKEGLRKALVLSDINNFTVNKTKKIDLSIGDELVTEKNILIGRSLLKQGQTFSVEAINQTGAILNSGTDLRHFSNDELNDLTLSHHYVRKPNQLTNDASSIYIALNGYQINKNSLGEIAEYSNKIKLFTDNEDKAREQLDKEKLTWSIKEVATGKPSLIYREAQFATEEIRKDLEFIATILCKDEKSSSATSIASVAVAYASAKLSEHDAAFEHKALLSQAMHYAMGKVKLNDIQNAIEEKAKRGDLLHANTYWISKEALKVEQTIINNNLSEQGKLSPVSSHARLVQLPASLTQGQKDAITLALSTQDRFASVQGLAGVGKTTMMRELQVIANEAEYTVLGLAPMHSSKEELAANGINAKTVAQFLVDSTPYSEKTLFIIDEASMIGNQDYAAIQKKIISNNARAVFTGDMTQLQSPSSGIPHELTVKTSTQKVAYMEEIVRQNPNPDLKQAAIHASKWEIKASFDQINNIDPEVYVKRQNTGQKFQNHSLIEINCYDNNNKIIDYNKIYKAIATDYLTRIPEHQDSTLVIAHTHQDRDQINTLIRQGLQQQGKIKLNDITCERLVKKGLSKAELLSAQNFKTGDMLRFDRDYSVATKGEYFTVLDIDMTKNRLNCHSSNNQLFSINPAKIALKSRMTVYTKEKCMLAEGDKIRLKLTDKPKGRIANTEYTISKIDKDAAFLRNESGCIEINLCEHRDQHWDYAYTTTAFGAQGSTANFVLALELAKRMQATTHRAHEIDFTRARYQATIYTENASALSMRLTKLEGDKLSAYQLHKQHITLSEGAKDTLTSDLKRHASNFISKPNYKRTSNYNIETNPSYTSAKEINQALTTDIEKLTHHLLGKPNYHLSSSSNLRYGNKGSLSINLSTGLWRNFETGEKGNALQLISSEMGFTNVKDSLSYAKDFLNYRDTQVITQSNRSSKENIPQVKDSPNKTAYAKQLYAQSLPIKGTLAERYLKQHRHLQNYSNADLRFLSKISTWHGDKKTEVPALLSIARDNKGEVNHVQVIRLNPMTGEKDSASRIIKQTYGKMNGYGIELNKSSDNKVTYITEGVETGLSLLEHDPKAKVIAVLSKSNFQNIDLTHLSEKVILCLDNDGQKTFKDSAILNANLRLIEAGKNVTLVMPEKEGMDFNDVLKNDGAVELKRQISAPMSMKEPKKEQPHINHPSNINEHKIHIKQNDKIMELER